jgi:hypothetical protein
VIDGEIAVVGSFNFDAWSYAKNAEVVLVGLAVRPILSFHIIRVVLPARPFFSTLAEL